MTLNEAETLGGVVSGFVTDRDGRLVVTGSGSETNVKMFGAKGDGTTDDTEAIQSAIDASGGGTVSFPPGTYVTTGRIDLSSNVSLEGYGAILHATDSDPTSGITSLLYATGSDGTKTNLDANAAAGARTVTLPSGQGANFASGDILGLESTTVIYGTTQSRELHSVVKVVGDVLTLDQPLDWAYNTTATAQFWKMTPVQNVTIRGLKFTSADPTTYTQYSIRLKKAQGCVIENVTLENVGGGIILDDAMDCAVTNLNINGLPNYGNAFGYGINFNAATSNSVVTGLRARDTRHVITTLGEQRSSVMWGEPRDCQITGAVGVGGTDTLAIFDTHEQARRFTFSDCLAVGSGTASAGFQMRGKYVTLSNCRAFGAIARGANGDSQADHLTIEGGEFSNCGTNGIQSSSPNTVIKGVTVRDNVAAGIATAAAGIVIKDCVISGNLYGVQDTGATTSFILADNYIQQGSAQTIGVLNFGDTAGAAAIASGNFMPGYTAGNAFSSVGASAVVIGTTRAKPTVTGSKGSNAALTSLMTALTDLGLVTDSTS